MNYSLWSLWWISADRQASLDGGAFPDDCDRDAEERAFTGVLLGHCATDEEREAIRQGLFRWLPLD